MRNFRKHSLRRGATVLIVVVVFLLAVLSGTIALTMASSNAGRFTHEEEDHQAYFSVASAARLILNTLEGVKLRFRTQTAEAPDSPDDLKEFSFQEGTNRGLFFKDSRFIENLKQLAPVNRGESEGGIEHNYPVVSFSLSLQDDSGTDVEEMGTVWVDLEMNAQDVFTFRLWSAHGDKRDYQMTMRVKTEWSGNPEAFPGSGEIQYYYIDLGWHTNFSGENKVEFTFEKFINQHTGEGGLGA